MVIAVLAIIWVVCLTPMMLRKLSERRFTTSVDSFHRQLPRFGGALIRACGQCRRPRGDPLRGRDCRRIRQRRALGASSHRPRSTIVARPPRRSSSSAARRRRVLLVLAAATLGFFVLGMIPALRVFRGLSLLAFAAAAGYLALLIYIHGRAVERQVKVIDIRDLRNEPGVGLAVQHSPSAKRCPGDGRRIPRRRLRIRLRRDHGGRPLSSLLPGRSCQTALWIPRRPQPPLLLAHGATPLI